ncbi:unnamed protein product [Onchocerca ochengi]|uniref:Uncharacterized protein n=1 Tax=Onchocerca ochengi TaxID=42157 RepID=A0A182EM14_ONCOC|nr:unnamed protein product [Onchocerca ochengi]
MYRVNKSYDELSSDDESPSLRKEQKLDDADNTMEDCRAGRKAAQMWTDLLAEQSLSETFSDKIGVYRSENDKVERGVESYVLPDVRPDNDQEMRYQMDHEVLSTADDSEPFDFIADEEKVDNFLDKDEKCQRGNNGRSRNRKRQRRINFMNQERNTRESWKYSASTSRTSGFRITKNIGNINNAFKRRRGDRIPNSLPNDDYSLETLMTTEFPQDITINELAERIVEALE